MDNNAPPSVNPYITTQANWAPAVLNMADPTNQNKNQDPKKQQQPSFLQKLLQMFQQQQPGPMPISPQQSTDPGNIGGTGGNLGGLY